MNLQDLRNTIPDYAKDLKLNLDSVLSETGAAGLDAKRIRVIALACAISKIDAESCRRRRGNSSSFHTRAYPKPELTISPQAPQPFASPHTSARGRRGMPDGCKPSWLDSDLL